MRGRPGSTCGIEVCLVHQGGYAPLTVIGSRSQRMRATFAMFSRGPGHCSQPSTLGFWRPTVVTRTVGFGVWMNAETARKKSGRIFLSYRHADAADTADWLYD